jgi:hypothetical protein
MRVKTGLSWDFRWVTARENLEFFLKGLEEAATMLAPTENTE